MKFSVISSSMEVTDDRSDITTVCKLRFFMGIVYFFVRMFLCVQPETLSFKNPSGKLDVQLSNELLKFYLNFFNFEKV